MNIHEFQAKDLMKKFGIKVLGGQVANTVEEAVEAAKAHSYLRIAVRNDET